MRLDVLFSELEHSDVNVRHDSEIKKVTAFAENCDENSIFIALHGFDEKGIGLVDIAVGSGARAIVLEHGACACDTNTEMLPLIFVPDIRFAYAYLCDRLCFSPAKRLNLFAVTGTNGKTSVAYLLSGILSKSAKTEVIGTVWNEMTTPDPEILYPLLRKFADDGVKNVVLEASSHALKLKKLSPLRFKVGIFTNLTRDHGDFHKTVDDYYFSKASLFGLCEIAVINLDDRYGRKLFDECPCKRKYGYSVSDKSASFFADNIRLTEKADGNSVFPLRNGIFSLFREDVKTAEAIIQKYDFITENAEFEIKSRMPWSFNVLNTLASAGAAYAFGIGRRKIQTGIFGVGYIPGRLERVVPKNTTGKLPIIFIDYAHTPDALENAILSLRRVYGNRRLIVLFGCGGERDREKRPIMGKIAASLADFSVITADNSRGENPTLILRDIISKIPPDCAYVVINDRKEAILFALDEANDGDILLIAGKGHENYIIDGSGKHSFNEKEIINSYLNG